MAVSNALFIPDTPGASSSRLRPPSRTFSIATQNSLPTEPLLQHHTSSSEIYQDIPNRQPNGTRSSWDMLDLSFDGDLTAPEKRLYREHQCVRRRLRTWKVVRITLEVVLGLWAIYTTVRYFIAYITYSSAVGQAFALALGCTTTLAFAFLICDAVVAVLQTRLIAARISVRSLFLLRTVFLYLSSFFLVSTSIVNLVVTIHWRRSHASELSSDLRCTLDIDVIWSIPSSKASCPPESRNQWTGWLALAIFRVAFTLMLVLSMLITTSQHNITRRTSPSQYTYRPRRKRRRRSQQKKRESSTLVDSAGGGGAFAPAATSTSTQQPSTSQTADCQTVASSSGDLGGCRDEEICLDPDLLTRFDPAALQQRLTDAIYLSPGAGGGLAVSSLPDPLTIRDDGELTHFVNRFRTLVSQITRETEDAMEYARPDTLVTATPVDEDDSDDDSDESFRYGLGFGLAGYHGNGAPFPPPALGYDEFGRPYPPEDHVRILNSYIRRMPTIESLGSREFVGTSGGGSVYSGSLGRVSVSMQTLSRPPTAMMNNSEFGGSEPPSRAASIALSLNMGGLTTGSAPHTPRTPVLEDGSVDPALLPSPSGVNHSRSMFSFHTANSGGGGSVSSPGSGSEGFVSFSSEDSRPP